MGIKILTKQGHGYLNCLDTLVSTMGSYWNSDYEYMFRNAWDFKFTKEPSPNKSILGSRIHENTETDYSALEEYHDFNMVFCPKTDLDSFFEIVREELQNNRPVAVLVDTYWCPWIKYQYQKRHCHHYCLITEVDDDNNLYVIESQLATTATFLSHANFQKGYDWYILFRKNKPRIAEDFDWRKSILERIQVISKGGQDGNIFEQIKMFAKAIPKELKIENEVLASKEFPFKSLFYRNFFNIGCRLSTKTGFFPKLVDRLPHL